MNNVYKVDDGEEYWVVADSSDEALRIVYSLVSENLEDYMEKMCLDEVPEVVQLKDSEVLEIRMDDLPSTVYKEIVKECGGNINVRIVASATAKDWARQEPGIIGSTLY